MKWPNKRQSSEPTLLRSYTFMTNTESGNSFGANNMADRGVHSNVAHHLWSNGGFTKVIFFCTALFQQLLEQATTTFFEMWVRKYNDFSRVTVQSSPCCLHLSWEAVSKKHAWVALQYCTLCGWISFKTHTGSMAWQRIGYLAFYLLHILYCAAWFETGLTNAI